MNLTHHEAALDTFVPMLTTLSEWLDLGSETHPPDGAALVNARLAADMYTLAQQVRQACFHACDGVARLSGSHEHAAGASAEDASAVGDEATSVAGMKAQIERTLSHLRSVDPATFAGAAERDCSIPSSANKRIAMNGSTFIKAWALPHFYFHVVTAYGILRQQGVPLGKQQYLSQVGAFIE